MNRIIVQTIDDMPWKGRGGLPLGCVLDLDGPAAVAFGAGATFSQEALALCTGDLRTYQARFHEAAEDEPIVVRAQDVEAALLWLRQHYVGGFDLFVEPLPVYLGPYRA